MGVIVRPELNPGVKPIFGSGYRLNPWHPLNQGLVAWWLLNEGGGATSIDLSPFSNKAVYSSQTWVNSEYGTALNFDGTLSSGSVADSTSLNPTSITISYWMYRTGGGDYGHIVSKWSSYMSGFQNDVGHANTAKFIVFIGGTGNDFFAYDNAIQNNVWYFISNTYDGNVSRIYINGVENRNSGNTFSGPISSASNDLRIGQYQGGGDMFSFAGNLHNISIHNYALPASRILELYSYPYGTPSEPRLLFPSTRRYFQAASGGGATQLTYSVSDSFSPSDTVGGLQVYRASFGENLES